MIKPLYRKPYAAALVVPSDLTYDFSLNMNLQGQYLLHIYTYITHEISRPMNTQVLLNRISGGQVLQDQKR